MEQVRKEPISFATITAIANAKEDGRPAPVIFVHNHYAAPCHCAERSCGVAFSTGAQEPVYIYAYKALYKLMRKHGWMVSRTAFLCPKHSSRANVREELQRRRNVLCDTIRQAIGNLNRRDAHAAVDAIFIEKEKC